MCLHLISLNNQQDAEEAESDETPTPHMLVYVLKEDILQNCLFKTINSMYFTSRSIP